MGGAVAAYAAQWQPAAQAAAAQLGIPWQWVLGQWGVEYGFQNGSGQGQNNPANLKALPGQSATSAGWANFSSVSDFVAEYVRTVKADFPWFASPTANPTPAQVFGSQQDYTTSQSAQSYTQAVLNAIATLEGTVSSSEPWNRSLVPGGQTIGPQGQIIAPGETPPDSSGTLGNQSEPVTPAAGSGPFGWLQSWLQAAQHSLAEVGTIVLGIVLFAAGLGLLVFAERTTIAEDLAGEGHEGAAV